MTIDYDESMNRYYIPVHPDWEIQTKGNGSSFRIAQRKEDGQRWMVADKYLHDALEQMARDIHDRIEELERVARMALDAIEGMAVYWKDKKIPEVCFFESRPGSLSFVRTEKAIKQLRAALEGSE